MEIVISGGSFIGLTLALALSVSTRGRTKVAVIDPLQIETPLDESDGRSFAISRSSRQMLEVLGIWKDVRHEAQPVLGIEVTDSALEAVVRPTLLAFDGDSDGEEPGTYILESHHLLNALKKAVLSCENVTLHSQSKIKDCMVGNGLYHIDLSSGKTLKAKLLIAADGKKSSLRNTAGIKTIGWSYGQMGLVTTIGHEHGHEGKAVQHFLPSGPFAILPLTGNRSSLVWSEKTDIAREMMAKDDEGFLTEIKQRMGHALGKVSLAGRRGMFPLNLQIAREFIAERFALVGDAAHGVHPIAGLGFNMGLRDVAALTEVIVEAHRLGLDVGSSLVLEKYSRWRRFDSTVSAFAMDGLNRLFSNDIVPIRFLRDLGIGLVNRSEGLKSYFAGQAAGLSGDAPQLLQGKMI